MIRGKKVSSLLKKPEYKAARSDEANAVIGLFSSLLFVFDRSESRKVAAELVA